MEYTIEVPVTQIGYYTVEAPTIKIALQMIQSSDFADYELSGFLQPNFKLAKVICPVCDGGGTVMPKDGNSDLTCLRCKGTKYVGRK